VDRSTEASHDDDVDRLLTAPLAISRDLSARSHKYLRVDPQIHHTGVAPGEDFSPGQMIGARFRPQGKVSARPDPIHG
jgi:hypothetical protein